MDDEKRKAFFNQKRYYVKMAISGTGQEKNQKIDLFKISEYLQSLSEKIAGEDWDLWLENVGLGKISEVKSIIEDIKGENFKTSII